MGKKCTKSHLALAEGRTWTLQSCSISQAIFDFSVQYQWHTELMKSANNNSQKMLFFPLSHWSPGRDAMKSWIKDDIQWNYASKINMFRCFHLSAQGDSSKTFKGGHEHWKDAAPIQSSGLWDAALPVEEL